MSYRVKTVCAMVGIPRPTLLAWERRYKILEPPRSKSGHRLYTDDDVAVLKALKNLVDQGYAISEAVRLQRQARAKAEVAAPAAARELHLQLADALVAFDRDAADRLMPSVGQLTFAQAIDLVYMPLLRETGKRWEEGQISIAQEHFVSGWCREQLFSIFHGLGSGPSSGTTAVCALAPGEIHELGMLAIAIHMMLRGWRVTWLGADLPIDELCRYVAKATPKLVCLSSITSATHEMVRAWAVKLREAAPDDTVVAVGGPKAQGVTVEGVVVCNTIEELMSAAGRAGTP